MEKNVKANHSEGVKLKDRIKSLSHDKLTLLALTLIEKSETKYAQPIAVISASCRLPEITSLLDYANKLKENDLSSALIANNDLPIKSNPAITEIKKHRYLTNSDEFDAEFFSISPSEAEHISLEQRIMLELAWEALESSGYSAQLKQVKTGIYVGYSGNGYPKFIPEQQNAATEEINVIHNNAGMIASRVAQSLELTGPAMVIDTGYSSSLAAVHEACYAIRSGQCDMALAGGIHLVADEHLFELFSQAGLLPLKGDGDEKANMLAKSDAAALVLLKPLQKAIDENNQILAVIKGSAINQNGSKRDISEVTQENLIREAMMAANVTENDIDYIEAHDIGTQFDNALELNALGRVFTAESRQNKALIIGSAKTAAGDCGAASGIIRLLKVILSFEQQVLFADTNDQNGNVQNNNVQNNNVQNNNVQNNNVHKNDAHKNDAHNNNDQNNNSHVNGSDYVIKISDKKTDWRKSSRKRIAGINSFDFSGTNIHLIIEEPPLKQDDSVIAQNPPASYLLLLSAKTAIALKQLINQYHALLVNNPNSLADICFNANTKRCHFLEYRFALTAASCEKMLDKLNVLNDMTLQANKIESEAKLIWVLNGQSQFSDAMKAGFYEHYAIYRHAFDYCVNKLDFLLNIKLNENSLEDAIKSNTQIRYKMAANFAFEYSTAKLWQNWGVHPDEMIALGTSEYIAACLSDVFSLDEALSLVAASILFVETCNTGQRILKINANAAKIQPLIAKLNLTFLDVSFGKNPQQIVAGAEKSISELAHYLFNENIDCEALPATTSYNPVVDQALKNFTTIAGKINFQTPKIVYYSNLHKSQSVSVTSVDYWLEHLLSLVQENNLDEIRIELSVCYLDIASCIIIANPSDISFISKPYQPINENILQSEQLNLLATLTSLYRLGKSIYWQNVQLIRYNTTHHYFCLPSYPFQRKKYPFKSLEQIIASYCDKYKKSALDKSSTAVVKEPSGTDAESVAELVNCQKTFLGNKLPAMSEQESELYYQSKFSIQDAPWLYEHMIAGEVVIPAALFTEIAFIAATNEFASAPFVLNNLVFHIPLRLRYNQSCLIETEVKSIDHDQLSISIYSRAQENNAATLHMTVTVNRMSTFLTQPINTELILRELQDKENIKQSHSMAKNKLFGDGEAYRRIEDIASSGNNIYAKLNGQIERNYAADTLLQQKRIPHNDTINATFLDTIFLLASAFADYQNPIFYLPDAIEKLTIYQQITTQILCKASKRTSNETDDNQRSIIDLNCYDEHGQPVAEIIGLELLHLDEVIQKQKEQKLCQIEAEKRIDIDDLLYCIHWKHQTRIVSTLNCTNISETTQQAESVVLTTDEQLLDSIERLAAIYIGKALQKLGLPFTLESNFTITQLLNVCAAPPANQQIAKRLLAVLAEQGYIARKESHWQIIRPLPDADPTIELLELKQKSSDNSSIIELFYRCVQVLPELLAGKISINERLFPGGSANLAYAVYRNTPSSRKAIAKINQAVKAIISHTSTNRVVKVLEIGAGTGATTAMILNDLPTDRIEYTFTDLSSLLLAKARGNLSTYSCIKYRLLDIEKDLARQGIINERQFDIVIAANILFCTQDLSKSLQQVQRLLRPDGYLILSESTQPRAWLDLTFGLSENWWRFSDYSVRSDYPFISPQQWKKLSAETGFKTFINLTQGKTTEQSVMVITSAPLPTIPKQQFTWLVFAYQDNWSKEFQQQLKAVGIHAIFVYPGDRLLQIDANTYQLNSAQLTDYYQLFTMLSGVKLQNTLFLWGMNRTPYIQEIVQDVSGLSNCCALLYLSQALLSNDVYQSSPLWVITCASQTLMQRASQNGFSQAALWGLARSLRSEFPTSDCRLIDLSPGTFISQLVVELINPGDEMEIAFNENERYVPRLKQLNNTANDNIQFHNDASYLITGEISELTIAIAHWMIKTGAGSIIFLLPVNTLKDHSDHLKTLDGTKAKITVTEANIAVFEEINAAFQHWKQELPPLKGVIHAQDTFCNAKLLEQTKDSFSTVFGSKVGGAWNLHLLTKSSSLDFMVYFSSISAFMGAVHQANYAAANSLLDSLAAWRQSRGLAGISINWGLLQGANIEVDKKAVQHTNIQGVEMISIPQALQALAFALTSVESQLIISEMNWSKINEDFAKNPYAYLMHLLLIKRGKKFHLR